MTGPATLPSFGVVVLTMGTRPDDLRRGLDSMLAQRDVALDIVVVGNGWPPTDLPDGVRAVALAENVGIPAGRDAGAAEVEADVLFFLDDDATLPEPDTLARIAREFAEHPDIGLIQPRVETLDGSPPPRRWTPRLRVGNRRRSSDITALWEGAVAVRRRAYDLAGGWAAPFFYSHEGIDLAWGVWDAGYRVRYDADLVALHPAMHPTRHDEFYRLFVRNRIYLARRRLPWIVGVGYLSVWSVLTAARLRGRRAAVESWRGVREGLTTDAGPRRPMHWVTIWRMAKAGRPPII